MGELSGESAIRYVCNQVGGNQVVAIMWESNQVSVQSAIKSVYNQEGVQSNGCAIMWVNNQVGVQSG